MDIKVALARMIEYESTLLDAAVAALLEDIGFEVQRGDRVLVKPNLVNSTNAAISCTNPLVVRSACRWLQDQGARVTVADSPAFGSAAQVARASGLARALNEIGLKVATLGRPVQTKLPCGVTIGISRDALDAGTILNVPRLKAHGQIRVTAGVKNLFGCVCGARKALAHNRLGDAPERFVSMLVDLAEILPYGATLLDAVHPMHKSGPIKGEPYPLGMLAASTSAHAVDTAVYDLLNLTPADVSLWAEAIRRDLPGAQPGDIRYSMEQPDGFDASNMILPDTLDPIRFDPLRVVKGRLKSLKKRLLGD